MKWGHKVYVYLLLMTIMVSCGKAVYVPGLPSKRLGLSLTAQSILVTLLKSLEDKLKAQGNLTDQQIKDLLFLAEERIYTPVENKSTVIRFFTKKSYITKDDTSELQLYAPLITAGAVEAVGDEKLKIEDNATKKTTLETILDHSILSIALFNKGFTSKEKLTVLGLSITELFSNLEAAKLSDYAERVSLTTKLSSRCIQNLANINLERSDNVVAARYCLKFIIYGIDKVAPPDKASFLDLLGQIISNGHGALDNGFFTSEEIIELTKELVQDELRAAASNESSGNSLSDLLALIAQIAKQAVAQIANQNLTELQMAETLANLLEGGLTAMLEVGFEQDELSQAIDKYVQSSMDGLLEWTGADFGQLVASIGYLAYGSALGLTRLDISEEDKISLAKQLIDSLIGHLDELGLPSYLIQKAVQSITANIYQGLKDGGMSQAGLTTVINSLIDGATNGLAQTGLTSGQQTDALNDLTTNTLTNPENYVDPYLGQIDPNVTTPAQVSQGTISKPSSSTGTINYSYTATVNTDQYALKLCTDQDCGASCSAETTTANTSGSFNFGVADGTYYLCVQAQNTGSGQLSVFESSGSSIIIDNTTPDTPVVSDSGPTSNSTTVPINFTAIQDLNFVEYEVDMCLNTNCTSCVGVVTTTTSPVNYTGLTNGQTYYACVWQKDLLLTSPYGRSTNTVTIDTNLPTAGWTLTVSPALNGGYSNDPTPILSRTSGVPPGSVEFFDAAGCNLGDSLGTATVSSGSVTLSPSSYSTTPGTDDGLKDFHGKITDDGGNTGPCVDIDIDYNYDITPPSAPVGLSLNTPATSPGATATPTIDVDVTVVADQVQLFTDSTCTTSISSATSVVADPQAVTTNSVTADATTTLYVGAVDLASNSVCVGAGVNISYFYDSIDPVVTIDSSYPASWDVTIATGTSVSIGPDTTNGASPDCTNGDGNVTVSASDGGSSDTNTSSCSGGTYSSANVDVSGLNDGNLTLTASQTDAAGRTGTSSSVIITKDVTVPSITAANIQPTVATGHVYQTSSSYSSSWSAATDATSGLQDYDIRACENSDCVTGCLGSTNLASGATNYNLTSLTSNKAFYICLQAKDNAGNQLAWGTGVSSRQVFIDNTNPGAASSITPTSLTAVSATSYTPTFTNATDSFGVVASYNMKACADDDTCSNSCTSVFTTTDGPGNSTTLTGLTNSPTTDYQVCVQTVDTAGNTSSWAYSNTLRATNLPVPTGITWAQGTVSSSNNSNDLYWTNNGYQYNVMACTDSNCSLNCLGPWDNGYSTGLSNLPGMVTDSSYYGCVQSHDGSGGTSDWGYSALTLTIEQTPPTGPTTISPSSGNVTLAAGAETTVTWSGASDASGIASYKVKLCSDSGCTTQCSMTLSTTSTSQAFALAYGNTFYTCVAPIDNAGNIGSFASSINYNQWDPPYYNWTWLKGSKTRNGLRDTNAGATATPQYFYSNWMDASDKLWLFEGLNLGTTYMWSYDGAGNDWVLVDQGSIDDINRPSSAGWGVHWRDGTDFYLFSGRRSTPADNYTWKYDSIGNSWTLMSGSYDLSNNIDPVVGTLSVYDVYANSHPGAKTQSAGFYTGSGEAYILGGWSDYNSGSGYGSDMWKTDLSTGEWAYLGGFFSSGNSVNTDGDLGVESSTAWPAAGAFWPGGRFGHCSWTGKDGRFWIYGGIHSYSSHANRYNDLWRYNPSTSLWTRERGTVSTETASSYATPGVRVAAFTRYGQMGKGDYSQVQIDANEVFPVSRDQPFCWTDSVGNLWLMGGESEYYDESFQYYFFWNGDVWKYDGTIWVWMTGQPIALHGNGATGLSSRAAGAIGLYGTQGTASRNNRPGGRTNAKVWIDSSDKVYIGGGYGHDESDAATISSTQRVNDLWMFEQLVKISITTGPYFGNIAGAGPTANRTVTINNTSSDTLTNCSMVLYNVASSGKDFAYSSNTCGASLSNGGSCTIDIAATPQSVGYKKGTVGMQCDNAVHVTVFLSVDRSS